MSWPASEARSTASWSTRMARAASWAAAWPGAWARTVGRQRVVGGLRAVGAEDRVKAIKVAAPKEAGVLAKVASRVAALLQGEEAPVAAREAKGDADAPAAPREDEADRAAGGAGAGVGASVEDDAAEAGRGGIAPTRAVGVAAVEGSATGGARAGLDAAVVALVRADAVPGEARRDRSVVDARAEVAKKPPALKAGRRAASLATIHAAANVGAEGDTVITEPVPRADARLKRGRMGGRGAGLVGAPDRTTRGRYCRAGQFQCARARCWGGGRCRGGGSGV